MENRTVNVLIVDDRQDNLLALQAVLKSQHYRLISARSGHEALKWLLQEEFAVILLDVQMPGLNGFDTAKLIKERRKLRDIPILFITAFSQSHEHVMKGYSVGAIDYILKPFDPDVLKSKVDSLVNMYLHQMEIEHQRELLQQQRSELEKAYMQMRKSEALARAIGETSIDTVVTMDRQGSILRINPAVTPMFGYAEEELLGESIAKLLPYFREKPLNACYQTIFKEAVAVRKNGSQFPVDYQLCEAIVEGDSIWVCSIRDITDKKQQYEVLENLVHERTQKLSMEIQEKQQMYQLVKENEEKYRQLVEDSPETIIVRKMKEGTWSFINETGLKLLGAKRKDQVVGKGVFDFVHPDDHHKLQENMEQVQKGRKTGYVELRCIRLDGEIINVQVKSIPFFYHGEPSMHLVVRDITELKRSREIIQQSEKLHTVGELAAGIAHEIRNPLTSLRGFVQLMEMKNDSNRNFSQIMLSEIDRINVIVSELLLLAKPSKRDFRQVELRDLIESVLTLLEAQANLYNVAIRTEISAEPLLVYCEEMKLKQVMINILKNAIESMPEGGAVTVQAQGRNGKIFIRFKDQGGGIPEEVLTRIGQPFFTTKEKGTGLGLMISRSIIENHNGMLKIKSKVGKGTTVTITLPQEKKSTVVHTGMDYR